MRLFAPLERVIQTYLPEDKIEILKQAFVLARDAHEGQLRSSGEPYITHPIAVATILADMHLDYQTLAAAILHDVIEDTPIGYDEIESRFGHSVAELVEGVSKLDKLKFRNRKEAQAENFRKMIMAMVQDIRVILIKLADRTHNMRTLGSLRSDKRRRIAKETLEIYAPLAHRLGIHHMKTELEELGFEGLYPNRFHVISKVIKSARGNRKEMIQRILSEIEGRLKEADIVGEVSGREKNVYSIYQKMKLKEQHFHSIMDIYAFRIIVNDVDTCYRVLGQVHSLYKPRPGRMKDYIAIPKANGYQSLHTSMIGPHGVPVEVQIRTQDMEEMAEMGVAAHWTYKQGEQSTTAQLKARRWMQSLLELQQSAGNSFEFIESVKSDLFPDEIYVFTPKGRIVELPAGSTPVDFAYAVHTDVGNSCVGARVDRNPYPLSHPLSSGQTVEVITAPGARPSAAWLNFVMSSKARAKIRQVLKSLKRDDSVTLGRRLLNHALVEGQKLSEVSQEALERTLRRMKLNSLDDLLAEIGLGNIMSVMAAKSLFEEEIDSAMIDSNKDKKLVIRGADGVMLTFAKCCHPIPGDPIIGYISPDKGLVIHHSACRNITGYENEPDKFISVDWADDLDQEFIAEIKLEMMNHQGTIANLIAAINAEGSNIQSMNTEEKEARVYNVTLLVSVRDRHQINDIIRKITTMPDIIKVSRNCN